MPNRWPLMWGRGPLSPAAQSVNRLLRGRQGENLVKRGKSSVLGQFAERPLPPCGVDCPDLHSAQCPLRSGLQQIIRNPWEKLCTALNPLQTHPLPSRQWCGNPTVGLRSSGEFRCLPPPARPRRPAESSGRVPARIRPERFRRPESPRARGFRFWKRQR